MTQKLGESLFLPGQWSWTEKRNTQTATDTMFWAFFFKDILENIYKISYAANVLFIILSSSVSDVLHDLSENWSTTQTL